MTNKILRKITTLENIEEAMSECMLGWMHGVEVQRAQRNALNNIKEANDFDANWQKSQKLTCGLHAVANASTVAQGTHPCNALHTE